MELLGFKQGWNIIQFAFQKDTDSSVEDGLEEEAWREGDQLGGDFSSLKKKASESN